MAREITTNIWCDVCLDDDMKVPAQETPPITLGSWKPRVIALCETHTKEVFEPIQELLKEFGQVLPEQGSNAMARMPGTAPGSGIYPCPVPGCKKGPDGKPYKHIQSLRNHSWDAHNMSIIDLRKEYGGGEDGDMLFQADEDGRPASAQGPERAECDVAGCTGGPNGGPVVYEMPEHARPAQALGVHKARAHGIKGGSKTTVNKQAREERELVDA